MYENSTNFIYNSFRGELCMEIWKDGKGFEGIYQVSNFGNVKKFR